MLSDCCVAGHFVEAPRGAPGRDQLLGGVRKALEKVKAVTLVML
jgi:hypothetical protein